MSELNSGLSQGRRIDRPHFKQHQPLQISPEQQETGLANCAGLKTLLAGYKTRRQQIRANFRAEQNERTRQEMADHAFTREQILRAGLIERGLA